MKNILFALLVLVSISLASCSDKPGGPSYYSPSRSVCGNGDREGKEICDGTDLDDQSCLDLGYGAGALACKPGCKDFARGHCGPPASCGNATREGVEICDQSDLGGQTCESLGYGPGTLGCLSNCGEFDTQTCGPPPDCGDGEVSGIEVCDKDDFDGLTCQRMGYTGGSLRCAQNCLSIDSSGCNNTCTPLTCTEAGAECGSVDNGCQATMDCGGCTLPETCGGGGVANRCGEGSCQPTTCAQEGKNCGTMDNGCGQDIECGSCTLPDTCNGGNQANVCGCTVLTCQGEGVECGQMDDGCGGSIDCGTCGSGSCDQGSCVSCTPDCSGRQCGLDPNCGISCGSCNNGQDCVGGYCQDENLLCADYTSQGRLQTCSQETPCTGDFSCLGGGIYLSAQCLDDRPCASSPTAKCCGQNEFCGTTSAIFIGAGDLFCCTPGEVMQSNGIIQSTCVDAGASIACSNDGDCPTAWNRGRCKTTLSQPQCVECLSDNDCGSSTPACDLATNTCRACNSDLDCSSGAPACNAEKNCVECTGDQHCTSTSKPGCNTTAQQCVECTGNQHCGGTNAYCASNTCVECIEHSHCTGAEGYCQQNTCVECVDNNNCSGSTPYCRNSGVCDSCPDLMIISLTCSNMTSGRRACYSQFFPGAECTVDGDCESGEICDTYSGTTKGCLIRCT